MGTGGYEFDYFHKSIAEVDCDQNDLLEITTSSSITSVGLCLLAVLDFCIVEMDLPEFDDKYGKFILEP